MKKKHNQFNVLTSVLYNYVYKSQIMRLMIVFILFFVVIGRFAELYAIKIADTIRLAIENGEAENKKAFILIKFFLISMIHVFFLEFIGFIFVAPLQKTYILASKDLFNHYLTLDYVTFSSIGSGEIHNTIERKAKAVSDILEVSFLDIMPILLGVVFVLVDLYLKLGFFAALILFLSLIVYLIVTIKTTKLRIKLRKEINKRVNVQSNTMYDSLQNFESILAYTNAPLEVNRFEERLKSTGEVNVRLYQYLFMLNFFQKTIFLVQMVLIICAGIYGYKMDKFTVDGYSIYLQVIKLLASMTFKVGYVYSKYTTAIIDLLGNTPSEVIRYAPTQVATFNREIRAVNLNIWHTNKCILKQLDFVIYKGEKVAIVGRNGVGKSSLVKAFLGFVEYSGDLFIDHNELRTIDMDSLRKNIGYIHQDSALFNDTVKYNIGYGNREASFSEIIAISKRIGLHDSFTRLSNGYETIVGERGMFLSGGERQKVAFARAALKNASILILDEPTASLDKEAELKFINRILTQFHDKTLIMIVHNLHLLQSFDKIVYIDETRGLEVGSHEELLAVKRGYYTFLGETE